MADVQVQQLPALAGNALAVDDVVLVVDTSAAEARKITVNDLISAGSALIPSATIPSAKVNFAAGSILAASLATDAVTTDKILADAVTGAKLADSSTCVVAANLTALQAVTGLFVGQLGLATDTLKLYLWQGSAWQLIKAAGSINTITPDTTGIVNVTTSVSGDTVTVGTSLDATANAAEFLAGPTGAAGTVGYRAIVSTDLPTATTTARGAVIINGGGLTMSGATAVIDNNVTPISDSLRKITYSAQGLITASTAVTGADLPVATSLITGAVRPGSGLSVDVAGVLNHSNTVTGTTQNGITYDNQGHVTGSAALVAADIPNLDASKITTGTFNISLLGTKAITGAKLADYATVKFGGAGSTSGVVTFPTPDFNGQQFFDSTNGDLYLYDGNTWQPITVISGDLVYAGTYNASTNKVKSVTTQGSAAGLTVGAILPAASATNVRYYVVVSDSGNGVSPAPAVALAPPDMIVSNGATWDLVDVSNAIAGQIASNISFTPYGNLAATNVQTAIQELDDEKLAKAGGVVTGELLIGSAGTFGFEGSTDNAYETYLTAVDPTADRTITFPDASGTIVLSGAIVNADINASAAIAFSKLASLTGGSILLGNSSNVATATALSGDVSITNAGVTTVVSGSTSTAGKLQLTDSTSSTSTTTAATPNSVKTAYDLANAALPKAGGTMTGAITFAAGQTISGYAALATAQTFTAAQRGTISTLTDGATITPDFAVANNFSVTLGGNRTLANPSNITAGQSGCIYITQDGTGSRTLSYGSQYDFEGGTAPTLTTTANAVDVLVYSVRTTGSIFCRLLKNFS